MSTPPTPYRSEIDSLEARKRALETELASVDERLKARRTLPLLDSVRVASPCQAKWDEMIGDERKRFCLSCDKHVYNISALPREEAEQFLADQAGGEVCIRYYQRADGTIMTSDCSVGVKKKQRKKAAIAIAGAGAVAFGAMAAMFQQRERHVAGGVFIPPPEPTPVLVSPPVGTTSPIHHDPIDHGRWVGGAAVRVDPPKVDPKPVDGPETGRHLMGRRSPPPPKAVIPSLPANRQ